MKKKNVSRETYKEDDNQKQINLPDFENQYFFLLYSTIKREKKDTLENL